MGVRVAQLYIGGKFGPAADGAHGDVTEKATGAVIGSYVRAGAADIDRAVDAARRAQPAGEVHVNDAHARHGAENQMPGFTRRQWIGVQRGPLELPAWTRRHQA